MRRKEREIKDRALIDRIINRAEILRLAMCSGNSPYLVPVNFGYDGKSLYIHSAGEGKKIDLLKENNTVCFEMDTGFEIVMAEKACSCTGRYMSVIGAGKAFFVEGREEKVRALNSIMEKYTGNGSFEYSDKDLARVTIIRIDIVEMHGKKAGYADSEL